MKKTNGITLVALVITIIILLILAGITISQLTGSGLFENAKLAEEKSKEAQEQEYETFNGYEQEMNKYLENGRDQVGVTDEKVTNIEAVTSHTPTKLTYTWKELGKIAKAISDNDEIINNNTAEVKMTIGGKNYIVGVGDTTTVTYEETEKTVRILGFNHDKLVVKKSYDELKENTYAGISFEFVDFIMDSKITSTSDVDSNAGGWEKTILNKTLNYTTINSLSNIYYIKDVLKSYQVGGGWNSNVSMIGNRLWLLSCSEIWTTGSNSGWYGYTVGNEGEQYKYYKDALTVYNEPNVLVAKGNGKNYWLRSPLTGKTNQFCFVTSDGVCSTTGGATVYGVAPGFSI